MNRLTQILIIVFLILSIGCKKTKNKSELNSSASGIDFLINQYKNPSDEYIMVVAHRGDWRNFPENSLEAIESAINLGVDMVEIDIGLTKDSVLVLMHDETVERTTNGKGALHDLTLKEVNELQLNNGYGAFSEFKVPTLEEALLKCKGKVLVNLDKADSYINMIYPLLKKHGLFNQVIIKGIYSAKEFEQLFGEIGEEINYMPIINNRVQVLDSYVREFEANINPSAYEIVLNQDFIEGERELKNVMKNNDNVWINSLYESLAMGRTDDKAYFNPDENWGWIIDKGATIIQTDRPKELIAFLKLKGKRNTTHNNGYK